jgi:hypothetical protein
LHAVLAVNLKATSTDVETTYRPWLRHGSGSARAGVQTVLLLYEKNQAVGLGLLSDH